MLFKSHRFSGQRVQRQLLNCNDYFNHTLSVSHSCFCQYNFWVLDKLMLSDLFCRPYESAAFCRIALTFQSHTSANLAVGYCVSVILWCIAILCVCVCVQLLKCVCLLNFFSYFLQIFALPKQPLLFPEMYLIQTL